MKYMIFAALAIALSACNTFRGLGEDIEAGGAAIRSAANQSQDEINRRSTPQPIMRQPAPAYPAYPPAGTEPGSPYY